jgi:hypothetical protein
MVDIMPIGNRVPASAWRRCVLKSYPVQPAESIRQSDYLLLLEPDEGMFGIKYRITTCPESN